MAKDKSLLECSLHRECSIMELVYLFLFVFHLSAVLFSLRAPQFPFQFTNICHPNAQRQQPGWGASCTCPYVQRGDDKWSDLEVSNHPLFQLVFLGGGSHGVWSFKKGYEPPNLWLDHQVAHFGLTCQQGIKWRLLYLYGEINTDEPFPCRYLSAPGSRSGRQYRYSGKQNWRGRVGTPWPLKRNFVVNVVGKLTHSEDMSK